MCGDVSMAEDVGKTLKAILLDNGIDDPDAAIINLKVIRRYTRLYAYTFCLAKLLFLNKSLFLLLHLVFTFTSYIDYNALS